jgi:hypothetical protein
MLKYRRLKYLSGPKKKEKDRYKKSYFCEANPSHGCRICLYEILKMRNRDKK